MNTRIVLAMIVGLIFGYTLRPNEMVIVRWRWDAEHFDTMTLRPGRCIELSHSGAKGYAEQPCDWKPTEPESGR